MEEDDGIYYPKSIEQGLDLARPELRPILDRYAPRSALIVGRQSSSAELSDALTEAGWQVRACEGPGHNRCPLLEGNPCTLRESVDAAVVYIDGRATWPGSGLLPLLRCAADTASPAVVALEGRVDRPVVKDGHAVVGALRSPDTIMATMETIAGADPRVPAREQH